METATGADWILADSIHEDICLFSVGKSEDANPGTSVSDFSSYACMGKELVQLYNFTQDAQIGESLTLAYVPQDEAHQQSLSVSKLEGFFKVAITEVGAIEGDPGLKTYSYDVEEDVFVQASQEMYELYLYIEEEKATKESSTS